MEIFLWLRGKVTALTCAGREQRQSCRRHTLLYSCLLPTSLTLVFYHLKLTENRGREEEACLTADKPQRLLLNAAWKTRANWYTQTIISTQSCEKVKNKWHKWSDCLVFKKKTKKTPLSLHFLQQLNWRHMSQAGGGGGGGGVSQHCVVLCKWHAHQWWAVPLHTGYPDYNLDQDVHLLGEHPCVHIGRTQAAEVVSCVVFFTEQQCRRRQSKRRFCLCLSPAGFPYIYVLWHFSPNPMDLRCHGLRIAQACTM